MLQTLQNIRERDPVRPSKLARHVDRDTEAIILRSLEKEPDQRYQSIAELKADIDRRRQGMPVAARSASSLYLLRKIIARHRYTSTVAALLLVIVLGFLCFSLQLCTRLWQTNRALIEQKELSLGQTAEFTGYARMAVLVEFLEAWQQGDRQSAGRFARPFAQGTREAVAVRFLLDERPLDDKVSELRQKLQPHEACFAEFVVAEHYLRDGHKPQARAAYRACLSDPDLPQKDLWLAVWVRNRLQELTDEMAHVERPAPSEGDGR